MRELLNKTGFDYRILNPNLIDKTSYNKYLHKKNNLNYLCQLEEGNCKLFPREEDNLKVNSLIIIFMPYLHKENLLAKGNISKYARGKDYHIKGRIVWENLLKEIVEKFPTYKFGFQCDIGTINERFYAGVSGLCMIGKSGNMIHEIYGSYGNIILIYTDLEIDEYKTEIKTCLNCDRCVAACPSNSIKSDGINNSKKCVSYLTQKKQELTQEESQLIKNSGYVFGCDICQDVCPLNKKIRFIVNKDQYVTNLELEDINISNREFKKQYKEKAFSWRGKAILERNIKIVKSL